MLSIASRTAVAVFLVTACSVEAFAPPQTTLRPFALQQSSSSLEPLMPETTLITPSGFGFDATVGRILQENSGSDGYATVQATDKVIDVMRAITETDAADVALVYNTDDQLLGLFTETDYIRFSTQRSQQADNPEASAQYLVESVQDYMTPVDQLVTLAQDQTANLAIATMQRDQIRHLLVADQVDRATQKLTASSQVLGVINLKSVMNCIQQDERTSLLNLPVKKYPNLSVLEQYREFLQDQANVKAQNPETAKKDILTVLTGVLLSGIVVAFGLQLPFLQEYSSAIMIGLFCLGYVGIILEEVLEFNKAGVALLMSTGLWVTYADFFAPNQPELVLEQLKEQLAEVSDICFFLLAASAIVEVVDAHQGFKVVTNRIQTNNPRTLFWIIGFLTFFLSAILNNLTVTIVMVSLLRKLLPDPKTRRLFGAMVVVAANAGGVWTPIGDVTTTMLWINHQLSTVPTITELFLPSVVCLVGSLAFLVNQVDETPLQMSGTSTSSNESDELSTRGQLVFASGIVSLLSVPVFNELTGLPPYLAMLTGLGIMWTLTDILHMDDGEDTAGALKVPAALERTDLSGILFFLGILMSIGVLDKSGLLKDLAVFLSDTLPSLDIIATVIGLASALIDNVPLVAATMGMYELSDYGTDDRLWQLIALCAGTGGSILVIGSASGVALMGLEKVDFLWYARNVSIGAAVGYFAGIATYLVQDALLHGSLFGAM